VAFTVLPNGRNYFATSTGVPAVGYKVYAFVAGTSTPKDTYTDYTGGTPNAHPIILDARGEAAIYWNGTYDVVLKDAAGSVIWGPERVQSIDSTLRDDLADSSSAGLGDALVATKRVATGAIATTTHAWIESTQSLNANDFTSVDPTGVSDSHAGLVAAIAATPEGGTLCLNGVYRCSAALSITKTMTIRGVDNRTGNAPDGNLSKSFIYFYNDTNGFNVTSVVVTFKSLIISGLSTGSSNYAIYATGVNNSLVVENCVIQSFLVGIQAVSGYYNKFTNSTIVNCLLCMFFDNCYNVYCSGITLNANISTANRQCIELFNGSSMSFHGGSIENFDLFGVSLYGGSSISLFGTYFEGTGTTGWGIVMASAASVTCISCHVYLTTLARFVSAESGATVGARLYSRNNRIVYPTDTTTCSVYALLNTDSTCYLDIAGDYWNTSAGVNTKYLDTTLTGGTGPVIGTGNLCIQYPPNHPSVKRGIDTTYERLNSKSVVTYSNSMTPDSSAGRRFIITATNGTAFTINAPTNTPTGGEQHIVITIRNTSGGALGAATWNAVFKMSAWTQPANGFSRSIDFVYDGTNWVQVAQTGVDVPN
jgi:hypothetical protein